MDWKIGFVLALLALFVLPFACAQETEPSTENIEAIDAQLAEGTGGMGPDNILYGLDVALDRLSLLLTFDKAEKARKGLQIARERLLEAKAMAEQGKSNEAEAAANEYTATLDEAGASADAIEDDGTEEAAADAAGAVLEAEDSIEGIEELADVAKERVRARLVAQGLSEEQIAHLQAVFERIEAHAAAVKQKLEQKRERVKLKIRAIANSTEEAAEKVLKDMEVRKGIAERKVKRAERELARANKGFAKVRECIRQEGPEAGSDSAEAESAVDDSEEVLDDAESAVQEKPKRVRTIARELRAYGSKICETAKQLKEADIDCASAKEKLTELAGSSAAGLTCEQVKEKLRAIARLRHIEVLERIDCAVVNCAYIKEKLRILQSCKGEGESIPVIPNPPECCAGLGLIRPRAEQMLGITGYCTANCGNGSCDEIESSYNCPRDCVGQSIEPQGESGATVPLTIGQE